MSHWNLNQVYFVTHLLVCRRVNGLSLYDILYIHVDNLKAVSFIQEHLQPCLQYLRRLDPSFTAVIIYDCNEQFYKRIHGIDTFLKIILKTKKV